MKKKSGTVNVINQVGFLPHDLTFSTVNDIQQLGRQLIAFESIDTFDLVNVQQSDSAGLALLLDLLRFAHQHQKKCHFINIPIHLNAFARVHGVDTLLF